jgi:hypothetical protein
VIYQCIHSHPIFKLSSQKPQQLQNQACVGFSDQRLSYQVCGLVRKEFLPSHHILRLGGDEYTLSMSNIDIRPYNPVKITKLNKEN